MSSPKEQIIIEILESYLEFLEYAQKDPLTVIRVVAEQRQAKWQPILEELKQKIQEGSDERNII